MSPENLTPSMLTPRFEEALQFACEVHRQQTRKGTTIPYVTHLMAAASLVGEHGGNEDQMIAALLHDAMEDQGVTRQEIERRFGRRVAEIVESCTDTTEQPKPEWRVRKERYVAHLRNANPDARLVSIADKVHNARAILMDLRTTGPSVWARFSADQASILWYYRALIQAARHGWDHPLVDELERTIQAIAELEKPEATQRVPPS